VAKIVQVMEVKLSYHLSHHDTMTHSGSFPSDQKRRWHQEWHGNPDFYVPRATNATFFARHALHGGFGVTPWSRITAQERFDDNSGATDGMMHRLPSLGLVYDA
jgi:hypothetical protein